MDLPKFEFNTVDNNDTIEVNTLKTHPNNWRLHTVRTSKTEERSYPCVTSGGNYYALLDAGFYGWLKHSQAHKTIGEVPKDYLRAIE